MAFEDTVLLYLAALLGAGVLTYIAAEVFNAFVTARAINALANTGATAINAVLQIHSVSTVTSSAASAQVNDGVPATKTP